MESVGNEMKTGTGEFDGRTVMVTGGSTLLGHGVLRVLQAAGATIAIVDIDDAGAKTIVDELQNNVRFYRTDITNDVDVAETIAAIDADGRGLYGLVNLACSYVDDGVDSTRAQWLEALNVNLVSTAMVTQQARPYLRKTGGAVVNFTSVSSKVAQTGRWVYPASKAALVQLTRSMAMDLARDGIRINSVSPGWTWSKIMDQRSGGDRTMIDNLAAPLHLTRRTCDPEEVGSVVAYLLSPRASAVTGADWAVDGGYSAMGPEQAVPAVPQPTEQVPRRD
ncbi:SDR family oxidoreductase [Mycolicibacterium sp. XJ1819]